MKIKSLEGLRGLAAFIVVIFHFFTNFYPALINSNINQIHTSKVGLFIATTPLNVLYSGNFAVCIFFVLSGFVLSYKFFVTKDKQALVASAYKRYLRLAIPVIFSILLFWIFSFLPLQNSNYIFRNSSILYVLHEALFGSFFMYKSTINPVLWTMSFEFYGSFIIFGFCGLFGKSKNRAFMYIFAIIAFWRTYFLAFILGVMLSDITVNRQNILAKLDSRAVKIILLFIGLFLGSYPNQVGKVEGSINIHDTIYSPLSYLSCADSYYQIIGAAIIIAVLLKSEGLSKFFSSAAMQFLGRVSFSMYLTHVILILYCAHPLFNVMHQRSIPYLVCFLIMLIIVVPLILVAAYFVYKYVDKPAINLSNYIYEGWLDDRNDKSFSLHKIKRYIVKTGSYIRNNIKKLLISFGLSILIVICSVGIIHFNFFYKAENIKININAKIPKDDRYQVFYTTKNGEKTFNELESVAVDVKRSDGFQDISFELPVNEITGLRLDFGAYTGTVKLKPVCLQSGNLSTQVEISNINDLFLNQIDKTIYKENILELTSDQVDPFIVFTKITKFSGTADKKIDYIKLMKIFILTFIVISIPILWIRPRSAKIDISEG